jgi:hypothetical protein
MQEQTMADTVAMIKSNATESELKRMERITQLEAELTAVNAQIEDANRRAFAERAALEQQVAVAEEKAHKARDARQHLAFAGGQALAKQQAAEARAKELEQSVQKCALELQKWALEIAELQEANAKLEARLAQPQPAPSRLTTLARLPLTHKKKFAALGTGAIAAYKYADKIGDYVMTALILQDMHVFAQATRAWQTLAARPEMTAATAVAAIAVVAAGNKLYAHLTKTPTPASAAEVATEPVVAPAVAEVATVAAVVAPEAEQKPGYIARAATAVKSAGLRTVMAVCPHLTTKNAATVAATAGAGYYGFTRPARSQAELIGKTVLHAASGTAAVKVAGALVDKVRGTKPAVREVEL